MQFDFSGKTIWDVIGLFFVLAIILPVFILIAAFLVALIVAVYFFPVVLGYFFGWLWLLAYLPYVMLIFLISRV